MKKSSRMESLPRNVESAKYIAKLNTEIETMGEAREKPKQDRQ